MTPKEFIQDTTTGLSRFIVSLVFIVISPLLIIYWIGVLLVYINGHMNTLRDDMDEIIEEQKRYD